MLAFGRPRAALLAGMLVAGSGVLGLQARLAAPDAMLVAATTLAAGALARLWLADDKPVAASHAVCCSGWPSPPACCSRASSRRAWRRRRCWRCRSSAANSAGSAACARRSASSVIALAALPWLSSIAALAISDAGGPDIAFLTRIGVPFALEAPPTTYALLAPLLAGPAMTFIFAGTPWLVANARRRRSSSRSPGDCRCGWPPSW